MIIGTSSAHLIPGESDWEKTKVATPPEMSQKTDKVVKKRLR